MAPLNPLDLPQVNNWLNQFDTADKYIAIRLITSIKYVSFDKFEEYIQEGLEHLIKKHVSDKRPVALFTVCKNNANQFNAEKDKKPANDSAGRIAHALVNIERQLGRRVEVTPRKESMIGSKVNHLVYFDDFIGTGNRFIDYWENEVPSYIKSWVSRRWCKVWIITYAAHSKGVKKIIRKIGSINEDSFITNHLIHKSSLLENKLIKNILEIYGKRTGKSEASLGYGKLAIPVIFQHGSPNNAPAILWASGKKNPEGFTSIQKCGWRPLFPERGIPSELYPLFQSNVQINGLPELLWSSGQYRLALSFLENIDNPKKTPADLLPFTILALMSSGRNPENIKNILMMTEKEFTLERKKLLQFQLCDDKCRVTGFGKDVLERNKRNHGKKYVEDQYSMFYPSAFMGIQREV